MSRTEPSNRPTERASSSGPDNPPPHPGSEVSPAPPQGDAVAAARFDQPTVISKQPPLPAPASSGSSGRTELNQALIGEQLEHFEILDFIGGGGMGAVYRARDTRLKRVVALKVLARDQAADAETVRRFRNEAESSARCDHENIARVHYLGEDRGLHFIAMEYIEGANIRDLVERRGPLPLGDAVSYTLQVAEALAHASSRDVVHRDIKPSNVIITPQGRAKLVDMGLARLQQVDPSSGDLTASGVTLGTFDYISPEQARDPRNADVRSDIYSLGCTMYFIVTGQPPYPQGTVLQKLLQHQGDEPPDPRSFNPDLPEDVSRVIGKMMAKDPRRRYQSASELVGDLVLLARQLGLRVPGGSSGLWIQPREGRLSALERHLPWIVPVASLVFIVIALQAMSGSGGRGEDDVAVAPSGARTEDAARAVIDAEDFGATRPTGGPARDEPPAAPGAAATREQDTTPPLRDPSTTAAPGNSAAANSTALLDEKATSDGPTTVTRADRDERPHEDTVSQLSPGPGPDTRPTIPPSPRPADPLSPNTAAAIDPDEPQRPDRRLRTTAAIAVLSRDGTSWQDYPSLRAACAAARDGDVIELQFSGPRVERPLELSGVDVTIRAAEGFQPVIVCRPSTFETAETANAMLKVNGGRLHLVGVALELDLARDLAADHWAMISARAADVIRLERCWLTIRNTADRTSAFHQEVAFVDVSAVPGSTTMLMADEADAALPLDLELVDCVVRGEADFLRCRDLQPLVLAWDNGLLAVTGRLLVASGGTFTPGHDETWQVNLRHVTVVAGSGAFQFTGTRDAPYQLPAAIRSTDCIFRLGEGAPLIEQGGVDTVAELREQLRWHFDRVATDGALAFLKVRGLSASGAAESLTLPSLTSFLRGQNAEIPPLVRVTWRRLPAASLPLSEHRPEDYDVEDDPTGLERGRGEAGESRDAGFLFANLPPEPPATAPEVGFLRPDQRSTDRLFPTDD